MEENFHQSILEFQPYKSYDLSFGVLIHVNPDYLHEIYQKVYQAFSRYILLCEYYNRKPVEVAYRAHAGKLFKGDFAREMLDLLRHLELLVYQFVYRWDPVFPTDDVYVVLMQKRSKQPVVSVDGLLWPLG